MATPSINILRFADIAPSVWDNVVPPPARRPMHLWHWAAAALDAYGARDEARVIVVGDPDAPAALVPLMRRPGPARWHSLIGNEGGAAELPCRADAHLPDAARALVRFGAPVTLGDYPAQSPLLPALKQAARGRALILSRTAATPLTPWLDLDESWHDPGVHLKKKMVQSIRRRERRLAEEGRLDISFAHPRPDEVPDALERAFHVEAQGWKSVSGDALAKDRRQARFFHVYAPAIAAEGRLHMTFVTLDDRPIAMSIGETFGGTYWAYKTGYDETFRKFAPGILMQFRLIGHLAETGVGRIDFQGQMDDFKRVWTDQAVAGTRVRIYPLNLRGALGLGSDVVKQARQSLSRKA